jgi:hypothetical protein
MKTTQETYVGLVAFHHFQDVAERAKEKGWAHWIGDIPVHKELLAFYKAFKDKRYNIVPCVDVGTKTVWKRDQDGEAMDGTSVYETIGITFPDTPNFRVGKLIVVPVSGESSVVYCVESEKIENEKYSEGSAGYNIRQSKDMKKSLKVAVQFLKPLDYEDVMHRSSHPFRSGLTQLRDAARFKLHDKLAIGRTDMAQEVANMIASGYVPSTTAFKNALDLLMTEGAELRRMQDYKPRACFVWVKPTSLAYRFAEDKEAIECTQMDDVPELIRNKLAVLQIAKNGEAIADVGVRVSDITYWVFA